MKISTAIRRRRLVYAIPGFIFGLGLAVIVRWLVGRGFAVFEALMVGAFGASLALALGQKFWGLPTDDDLAVIRLREEMSPLDLRSDHAVSFTLKTEAERKVKS